MAVVPNSLKNKKKIKKKHNTLRRAGDSQPCWLSADLRRIHGLRVWGTGGGEGEGVGIEVHTVAAGCPWSLAQLLPSTVPIGSWERGTRHPSPGAKAGSVPP